MEVKLGTLSSFTPTETVETQVQETQIETTDTVVDNNGTIQETVTFPETKTEETTTTETKQEPTQTVDDDVYSSFEMPKFGNETTVETEPKTEAKVEQPTYNWKEELKKADRKEILKELGYDDFLADFAEYRANGGDPYQYLQAKSFDWTKVGDTDIVFDSLANEYSNLDKEELSELFADTYKQGDSFTEEENRRGLIRMKADAHKLRTQRIEEQKNFKIPEIPKQQEVAVNQEAILEQERIQQAEQRKHEETLKFINEHEATKNLFNSKRVTINLGEGVKPFNFKADPEVLQSVAFGKNWIRAISVNPQEADESKLVIDVAKVQKAALMLMNPNYEKDIFEYGKSFGHMKELEQGQNAKRPNGNTPTTNEVAPTYKLSKGGSR
jgi:hypothetical protein